MIDRSLLKSNAKQVLRGTYWFALLMSLVLCLAGATSFNGNNSRVSHNNPYSVNIPISQDGLPSFNYSVNDILTSAGITNSVFNQLFGFLGMGVFIASAIILTLLITAFSLLFRLLIGYPLEVGARGYFADTAEGHVSGFERLKYSFTNGYYGRIVTTMLMRSVYTLLWTLLFIIPGIIKGYAYSMVPYLLADNPSLDQRRALELSQQMTDGYKGQMFVLDLSFIGWYLLGSLAFFIGQVFVWPYHNATLAQLYLTLRESAIRRGITSYEELGIGRAEMNAMAGSDYSH